MKFENLETELVKIFKEQLGENDITPESKVFRYEMDSLDFVEITLEIESRYKIQLPEHFEDKLHEYVRTTRPNGSCINDPTIRDMADYINAKNTSPFEKSKNHPLADLSRK